MLSSVVKNILIFNYSKIMLVDNQKGRELQNNGKYTKRLLSQNPMDSLQYFIKEYAELANEEIIRKVQQTQTVASSQVLN